MTFAEAAIEVLYRAGRPLHYKKITEAAIQEELLSHVGRTPEVTMGERLTQEAKKTDTTPVEIIRPGVYKLNEEYAKKLEEEGRERLPLGKKKKKPATNGSTSAAAEKEEEAPARQARESKSNGSEDRNGKSQSRRRRRRSKSADSTETTETRQSRGSSSDDDTEKRSSRGRRRKSNRRSSSKRDSSSRRRNGRGRDKSKARRKSSGRKSSGRKSTGRRNARPPREDKTTQKRRQPARKPAKTTRHLEEGPVRMDAIAQAAQTVLDDNKRRPMKIADLAKEIFDRKLVRFHTHDAAATVQAAMAGDNQIREQVGNRPLFIQYDRSRWGLTHWGLSEASVEREQSILSLAEEIRQDAVETLGQALTDIKTEAVEHLALTLLERLGYRDIKVSKRSSDGDVFFTSDWRQGLADVRVCIQVVGDSSMEISDDIVTELRGTLHHYSASEGVIIHLGDIDKDAIEESREERVAPITLIDRDTFVELLIKHGIGVRTYQTPITMVDTSFIDALATA